MRGSLRRGVGAGRGRSRPSRPSRPVARPTSRSSHSVPPSLASLSGRDPLPPPLVSSPRDRPPPLPLQKRSFPGASSVVWRAGWCSPECSARAYLLGLAVEGTTTTRGLALSFSPGAAQIFVWSTPARAPDWPPSFELLYSFLPSLSSLRFHFGNFLVFSSEEGAAAHLLLSLLGLPFPSETDLATRCRE